MENQLIKDTIDTETNHPGDLIVSRFKRKFQERREREEKQRKWERKRNDDVDFENDDDGMDPETRMTLQRQREDQKRVDRRKRIKEIRNEHRNMERQKANSQ